MVQLATHLHFNGNCEEALRFYSETLGGEIGGIFRYEGSPASGMVPADWGQKVLHANMTVAGRMIMAADAPPNRYVQPAGFAVSVGTPDPEEAKRIFDALAGGGSVQMPLQATFWSPAFGMVTDRFGTPWMVNCDQPPQG